MHGARMILASHVKRTSQYAKSMGALGYVTHSDVCANWFDTEREIGNL